MTEQEAIKELERHIQFLRENWKPHPDCNVIESLGMATHALEIMQKLRHRNMTMEALEEYMKFKDECVQKEFTLQKLLEAMEKRIPKKPKYLQLKEGITKTNYECPICGCRRLGHGINLDKCYCPECGQKLDWSKNRTGQELMIQFTKTAAVGRSDYIPKPRAIYLSFSSHDCETMYRCPVCNENFGSWSVFGNKENESGTKQYCPLCKTELDGLE